MSQLLIQHYLNQLADLRKVSGTNREIVVREAERSYSHDHLASYATREGARNRPEEFAKRLRYFLRMTAQNRRFGFGGIKKHFEL